MRIKCVIFCVLAVWGSIFWACSRSDLISGVADGVVTDTDPTLTGRFDSIGLKSDSSYSLPVAASPAFSTTLTDSSVIAGVDGEGDTLAAYLQYNIAADTSRYNKADTLKGVYLYFAPADSTDSSSAISLSWVKTLAESAPVIRDDKHPDAGGDTVWPLKITLGGGNRGDSVNSVKLPDSIANKIFNARISNRADTLPFAFTIVNDSGKARRVQNPDMAIVVAKKAADSGSSAGGVRDTVRDTVRAKASRFTAFENAGEAEKRAQKAYTSRHTLRTAVFRINLGEIKKRFAGYTNLNAVITVNPGDTVSGSAASHYRIFVSDTLFDESHAEHLNARFASGSNSSSPLKPVQPYNTLSISASQSINPSLQSVLDRKKETLYVYLRADSDGGVIVWNDPKPVSLETVFIPSR